jgi:hypothetical protein
MAGLRQSVERQELLAQSCSGVVVTLRDRATASIRSTLMEFGREREGGAGWEAVGFHDDEVRKDDGTWRFVRRTLRVRYMASARCPVRRSMPPERRFSVRARRGRASNDHHS